MLLLLALGTPAIASRADEKFDFSKLDLSKLPPAATKTGLAYAKDIRPMLENSCFRCHGPERSRGGLRLDSLEAVLKGGEDGRVVVPRKSKESPLVVAISQIDEETAMPPRNRPGQFGGGPGGPPNQGGPGGPGGFREGRGPGDPGGAQGRGGFGPGMFVAPQILKQADKNGDQKLSKQEFTALAEVWFDKLDADKSGKVNQQQFTERLAEILPPPQGFGPRGGGQPEGNGPPGQPRGFGPARFIGPGLFSAADGNKDGELTRAELKNSFAKWFTEWDTEKSNSLDEGKIRDGLNTVLPRPNFGGPGGGGPGGPGGFGPPPKPLAAEQVGLVRAWIDQGAR